MTTKYLVSYSQMEGDNYAGGYVKYQKVVDTIEQASRYNEYPVIPITLGTPLSAEEILVAQNSAEELEATKIKAKEMRRAERDLIDAQERLTKFS